jgi:3'-phosphoadenosine 5'-phosphosulfate sulfotransferase (PAPS reductase)/FAD synthetase
MNGLELMDTVIAEHKPVAVYGLFSGGHDSLTATHLAAQHPAFTAAVHINTGIGIDRTRQFVRETCAREGWPLKEYRAKEDCDQDYRQIVLRGGFPGPAMHTMMYSLLKERALRRLIRETKQNIHDRVMLVTGVRKQESQRRMGHVEAQRREGVKVWVNVIHDYSKPDREAYIASHGLARNPVVDAIGMSGECLCGAFAHPGELAEIETHFPGTATAIRELEREVRASGFDWGWEDRPPRATRQAIAEALEFENDGQMMLCYGCISKKA